MQPGVCRLCLQGSPGVAERERLGSSVVGASEAMTVCRSWLLQTAVTVVRQLVLLGAWTIICVDIYVRT